MFNLGYKEVLLNSDDGVTLNGGVLSIKGYGDFDKNAISELKDVIAVSPTKALVEWEVPITGIAVGDALNVVIEYKSSRNVSSQARNYIEDGKRITFTSLPITTVDEQTVINAIVDGYNAMFDKGIYEKVFSLFVVGSGPYRLKAEVESGFEYISLNWAEVKIVQANKTQDAVVIRLNDFYRVDGDEGHGLGKFLEESRRMGTAFNSLPYSAQHGGNSIGIDVRGKYRMTAFEITPPVTSGWASHEYVDHSYVQADAASKPVRFVIYANEASSGLMSKLDTWTTP